MARYVVMQPDPASCEDVAGNASIVNDGFVIVGFLFPPLWLAWHRLWLEAALAFAALLGLALAGEAMGLQPAASALSLLVSIFVGLEGPALRLAGLRRRGWTEWGAIEADSLADAEIRYSVAASGTETRSLPNPSVSAGLPWHRGVATHGPALGLLGYPGRG